MKYRLAILACLMTATMSAVADPDHGNCPVELVKAISELKSTPPQQRLEKELKTGKVRYMSIPQVEHRIPGVAAAEAKQVARHSELIEDYTTALALSPCQNKFMEIAMEYAKEYNALVSAQSEH